MSFITPHISRAARAALGLSQKEAARQIGVGFNTLKDFERGARAIRPETERRISVGYRRLGARIDFDGSRIAVLVSKCAK